MSKVAESVSWVEEGSEIKFRSIAKDLETISAEVVISDFFDDDVTDEIIFGEVIDV